MTAYEGVKSKHLADATVHNEGTIVVIAPLTEEASAWLDDNVEAESWQWFGGGLCVEHRFADDLINGMQRDGLTVEGV